MTESEDKISEFLSKATLCHRSDGLPVYDVQYLLSEPGCYIETEPEKAVCCPFVMRDVLLGLKSFQRFGSLKESDYTTDGVLLSYKWENEKDPDASGVTLEFIKSYLRDNPSVKGCFVDYMCLPQEPRTSVQHKIFKTCLEAINVWYTSYPVISCRVDERYFKSSWCLCESFLASHSQNIASIGGGVDPEMLMIQFLGNKILQRHLITKEAITKVKQQFRYLGSNEGEEMEMSKFVQAVLANIMLRIAHSHATNGSDKMFIIEIMRAFTESTRHFVSDPFPTRGIICDVRFENCLDVVGILEDGEELHFKDHKSNPRDVFMGCTIARSERIGKDISFLFQTN